MNEWENDAPQVLKDIYNAIYDDDWMWIVTWGKNRQGKSTLNMKLAYAIYKDWDKVLSSIAWNLSQLRYKIKKGDPARFPTKNGLHMRVPVLILDDFGATSNKAKTQHQPAWDVFKGAFDTYSTKVAVILANMLVPSEPTYQIYQKFTHELFVPQRGEAKYDKVEWQQDYGGWRPRQDKDWIQTFTFGKVPDDVYKQYDDMRCSIADELDQQIDDIEADTVIASILRRLQKDDIELMELLAAKGQIQYDALHDTYGNKYHDALVRGKSRGLIVPIRKGTSYWYDLTDLGFQTLLAWQQQQTAQQTTEKPNLLKPLKTFTPSH